MRKLSYLLIFITTISCANKVTDNKGMVSDTLLASKEMHYAKGFKVWPMADKVRLSIVDTKDSTKVIDWFDLVSPSDKKAENSHQIAVPCRRIICLSSTQLAYFFELDAIDSIVGINTSRHLFNAKMNELIEKKAVRQVGKEGHFNIELIAALNPDVVFVSPFKIGGYDALKHLGFPLVPMAAYSEETPLARAEWIKMMALFVGKEQLADSLFSHIEKRYNYLKHLTDSVVERPTVFSGKMKSGVWYVPGGDSFYAHYFSDAGAKYIIDDDNNGAYPMDFETLYQKAVHCDYWRLLVSENSNYDAQMLVDEDIRYADFDAFKNRNVMVCNMRQKPFYETNPVKPHIILSDYIHFFHPELLPNYKPTYYEPLRFN